MPIIDADAHVVESEQTWNFMDPSDRRYRPTLISRPEDSIQYWMIDGQIQGFARQVLTPQRFADVAQTGRVVETTLESRDMEDIEFRLRHMDDLGIDVQVLYPTMFLTQITDRPEVEVPICLSYNRWMADGWKRGKGRLRWACVLPMLSISDALDQLRFAKENGAVTVFLRCLEGERLPHDPYFYPLYEEISRLDMCVGMHVACANPYVARLLSQRNARMAGAFWHMFLNTVGAFHSIIANGLMKDFPNLRLGILEAGADWLPFLLKDLKRRPESDQLPEMQKILSENRLYVSVHAGDDVPYVVKCAGEDSLIVGTDYGHTDTNSDLEMLDKISSNGELSSRAVENILENNPRRFYGL